MKEPYGKGVANHPDPEPYAVSREAGGGAMARARIGWVLSSVIAIFGGADAAKTGGRQDSERLGNVKDAGKKTVDKAKAPSKSPQRSQQVDDEDTASSRRRAR